MVEDKKTVRHDISEVEDVEALVERVESGDKAAKKEAISIMLESQEYRGPIPPPNMLMGYENIKEGFADRIMQMAEKEQDSHNELKKEAVRAEIKKDIRAQYMAFFISIFLISASVFIINAGHIITGTLFASTTLVGAIGAFLYKPTKKSNK